MRKALGYFYMVAVINFGGQYAHLIARRIRELGVKSQLVNPNIGANRLLKLTPQALIFSGSPSSVYEKNAPNVDRKIYDLNIPILGICYGQQLMAYELGGKVSSHTSKQFGKELLDLKSSPLFFQVENSQSVWFSHGDQVDKVPAGFKIIASSKNAPVAAMENPAKKFYGVQFHPEVTHTPAGMTILSNFLFKIAKVYRDWSLAKIKDQIIKGLKTKIKNEKTVLAISGGVDSLVAAAILKDAIGQNLYLVFLDTGLLRKYDISDLHEMIQSVGFKKLKIINAKDRFLRALKGVVDPEEKRQKIAKLYFETLEDEARKIGKGLTADRQVKFLAQGTIYPDRIESAILSKHADKIKSHHNVTLPHGLKLAIIEPLSEFYKDEVRTLGKLLAIPEKFLNRHPFPGPGLAIRILGEVTKERLEIVREADAIFIEELKKAGIYNKEVSNETSLRPSSDGRRDAGLKVAQALVALLPVKAVGVAGDARTYSYIIALRSVDTVDFMTADWSKIPQQILEKVSSRIVNEVRGVNRVVYDITQKPPATIEYE